MFSDCSNQTCCFTLKYGLMYQMFTIYCLFICWSIRKQSIIMIEKNGRRTNMVYCQNKCRICTFPFSAAILQWYQTSCKNIQWFHASVWIFTAQMVVSCFASNVNDIKQIFRTKTCICIPIIIWSDTSNSLSSVSVSFSLLPVSNSQQCAWLKLLGQVGSKDPLWLEGQQVWGIKLSFLIF